MSGLHIGTKVIEAAPQRQDNHPTGNPGYRVRYPDGYESWSPKKVFEEAYQPLDQMSFGHAVHMLKLGHKVARAGWNGKSMWLYLVPANSYPAQTDAAKTHFGAMVPYRAYIAMVTAQGDVVPWLASQSDVLEEDWTVVP